MHFPAIGAFPFRPLNQTSSNTCGFFLNSLNASSLSMVASGAVSTTAGISNPLIFIRTMREIPVFSTSAFQTVICQRLDSGEFIFGGGWPVCVSRAEWWPSCPALIHLTASSPVWAPPFAELGMVNGITDSYTPKNYVPIHDICST